MPSSLDSHIAQKLAATALASVRREYPFHLSHLLRGSADVLPPETLHPAFHGCYDWHSCVHMHWSLLRLWQGRAALHGEIEQQLDERLTPAHIGGEVAYFEAPGRASYERPYGWAWLLKLHRALLLAAQADVRAAGWRDAVAPLAHLLATRCVDFLGRSQLPVRAGTHGNSAFALRFALQWAETAQHPALRAAIHDAARRWFGSDHRYPADYETGGDDFVSGGLAEAVLMQRVLDGCDWSDWWEAFAPREQALSRWLVPVAVSDARDAKIVHLHGLNLSRAWCWRSLAPHLPEILRDAADKAIAAHLAVSLPAATSGDYVGTHWLASFALLALGAEES